MVWHPQNLVGRYTLVIGQREVLGGDSNFARKLKEYWTPVDQTVDAGSGLQQSSSPGTEEDGKVQLHDEPEIGQPTIRCNWFVRLLTALFGAGEQCQ